MRRTDLIKKIHHAAVRAGTTFVLVREGGSHSIFRCGGQCIVVPRHREISEMTARGIMRDLDAVLGKDWWK
ncbi:hypothetical protein GCM10022251_03170 [Phytohabitans flavus]|uniref:Addiction module toxin, HicA family protein n=1 Tax=Phytohabitans flavus TaxID=1076124 RepID=A0A6F8Y340_9ACTN|nr:type II toxin-antitoxin system HicA family toxin [Phytohabitans flavus]BCB80534.1 hypothetical protein Pflav_069440 [Phytohabitans flavus]